MPEPIAQQYLLIGHVSSAHGVDGTVLFIPVPEAADPRLFEQIELVWLQNERGDLVPARISSVQPQVQDDRVSFFVKFMHVSDRTEAQNLNGRSVLIDKSKTEHVIADEHAWQSFDVLDENQEKVGTVEQVTENPAHFIINVATATGSLPVPCVDEYVTEVDEAEAVIRCKNLDQLKALE